MDVSHPLKVSEGSLIVQEGGEGIRGGHHTADVQSNASNGHQSGQHFQPVPEVPEVGFPQLTDLEHYVD